MEIDPTILPDVFEMSQKAYQLYDSSQIEAAVKLTLEIGAKSSQYTDEKEQAELAPIQWRKT